MRNLLVNWSSTKVLDGPRAKFPHPKFGARQAVPSTSMSGLLECNPPWKSLEPRWQMVAVCKCCLLALRRGKWIFLFGDLVFLRGSVILVQPDLVALPRFYVSFSEPDGSGSTIPMHLHSLTECSCLRPP